MGNECSGTLEALQKNELISDYCCCNNKTTDNTNEIRANEKGEIINKQSKLKLEYPTRKLEEHPTLSQQKYMNNNDSTSKSGYQPTEDVITRSYIQSSISPINTNTLIFEESEINSKNFSSEFNQQLKKNRKSSPPNNTRFSRRKSNNLKERNVSEDPAIMNKQNSFSQNTSNVSEGYKKSLERIHEAAKYNKRVILDELEIINGSYKGEWYKTKRDGKGINIYI